jgi:hypothetical protein
MQLRPHDSDKEKKMKAQLIFGLVMAILIPGAYGETMGVAVDGTCEAGSCPATGIPFNSTDTLPFDFTFALPDGDTYLIYGSFTGTNDGDGGGSNTYGFEVVYEGNPGGGPSAADTITVQRDAAFQASLDSIDFFTSFIGAFSPGIGAASSASTCFDGSFGCLGPAVSPGSFDEDSSPFSIANTAGVFDDNKTFVSNFGAGSPVGSYIVWGQTDALPAPSAPEPASFAMLALGIGGIVIGRRARSRVSR